MHLVCAPAEGRFLPSYWSLPMLRAERASMYDQAPKDTFLPAARIARLSTICWPGTK
jgi:hypothetical protein